MNKSNISLVVAIVAVLVGGLAWMKTPGVVTVPGTNTITERVGGVNPDIPSQYLQWGGVTEWRQSAAMLGNAASTTVCALNGPAASSTLIFASYHGNTGSSTAMVLRMSKQANQYPNTKTYIGQTTLAANTDVVAFATSTDITGATWNSSSYLVFEVGMNLGAGTSSPTGTCSAAWMAN